MLSLNCFKVFSVFLFCMVSFVFIGVSAANEALDKQLIKATVNGDISGVKTLIKQGANINFKDDNAYSLQVLTTADVYDYTPLMIASKDGHTEIVKYLVDNGANVNAWTNKIFTALGYATNNRHVEIVKYLIDNGANVNHKSYLGNTALLDASEMGELEIVKYLVDNGADTNVYGMFDKPALMLAALGGHIEIVKYLAENGADINAKQSRNGREYTILMEASERGHTEIVKYLVEKKADTTAMTFPYWVKSGWLLKVKECIESGANINTTDYGLTIVEVALRRGHTEVVNYLVEKGADTTAMTFPDSVKSGWLLKIKESMKKGYEVNDKDEYGYTVLILASAEGNLEVVKYLLDEGADIDIADGGTDFTALMAASEQGNLEIVKYLVEKGANIHAKDYEGDTALTEASKNGHTEIIKLLKEAGVQK